MKALLIIFSLVLLLLIFGLWSGPGSYPDRWRLDDRTVILEEENKVKLEEINKIQAELQDVTSSKDALEERARSELGMTKKGETFFEVIMQADEKPKQNVASEQANDINNKSDSLKQVPVNNTNQSE